MAAVLLESNDPAALARFYRELLGVPLVKVELPGVRSHFAGELNGVYFAITPGAPRPGRTCVALKVESVVRATTALKQAGVYVVAEPKRTPLGFIARFRDPEGNLFELYQP